MDQRRGRQTAVPLVAFLLCGIGIGGVPATQASLHIDFDAERATWRNDDDPRILGRQGGALRSLGEEEVLANPLSVRGVLRFPPCRALPAAVRGNCAAELLPAGPPRRALVVPLEPALREAYLPLWEKGTPLVPPEQEQLEQAMQAMVRQLSGPILLRDLDTLLEPVLEAARRAEAVNVAPAMVASVRHSQPMLEVLGDLWRFRTTFSARDLSLPCDRLQQQADRFNKAAGNAAVQVHRQRPAGICLFCGNVCTTRTADRLLGDMKEAVIRLLTEGGGNRSWGRPAPQPGPTSDPSAAG